MIRALELATIAGSLSVSLPVAGGSDFDDGLPCARLFSGFETSNAFASLNFGPFAFGLGPA